MDPEKPLSSNQNYSNSERKQNAFLACSWRFLRSSTLEHIGKMGFRNLEEKLGKVNFD